MNNLWKNNLTSKFVDDLDWRVYSSRLLGKDPSLVLHGGGNTSVKIEEINLVGDKEKINYVQQVLIAIIPQFLSQLFYKV